MNREQLDVEALKQMEIGLDDTFKFHCTGCGMCCVGREDIILTPEDIYKASKCLEISPVKFINTYCYNYIGETSRMPIVLLEPKGKLKVCPLMDGRKCRIHNAKPGICAMYPLGRYVYIPKGNEEAQMSDIRYFLQPIMCGDGAKEQTVREWLESFGLDTEGKFFLMWQRTITSLSKSLVSFEKSAIENHLRKDLMDAVWNAVGGALYANYDTDQDFIPQYQKNVESITKMMQSLCSG